MGPGSLVRPVYAYEYNKNNYLKKETDPLSRVTEYVYNGRNDLIEVKQPDPDGGGPLGVPVTTLGYDLHRRNTSVTDPLGRVTSFGFDSLDRNTTVTLPDPDGAGGPLTSPVTTYAYDNIHRVKQVTDPLSNVTLLDHATWNRIAATLPDPDGGGPLGSSTTVTLFDAEGNVTSETDELGRSTAYRYDNLGRLDQITYPDPDGAGPLTSPIVSLGYDKSSNLTSVTDALGNVTAYAYDGRNRLTSITEADPDDTGPLTSPVTVYGYSDANELVTTTDALGGITTNAYDGLGRLQTVTAPDPDAGGPLAAPVTEYAYDAASRTTSVTDPLGNVTTTAYDNLDRVTSITEPDPDAGGPLTSPVTSFTYDLVGNLLTLTDPMGRATTYAYDNLDRNTTITAPDPDAGGPLTSPVTQFSFDAVNNLLSVTDPLSHLTSYQYDNLYRNTRITDANTGQTNFTYDAAGNMLTLTDPVSNTTTWTYDGLNRVIEEENELGFSRFYVYDANSNLTKLTDRNGRVTEYAYDDLNRNTQELWKDGGGATIRTLSFTYDAASQLTAASDPAASYSYIYDDLGRVTEQTQNLNGLTPSIVFAQGFDANSNRTSLSAMIGGTADFKNTYSFDNLNRNTRITQEDQAGGNVVADKRVELSYKADGQFDVIARYADLAGTQDVATTAHGYDGMGRLTSLDHTTSGGSTTLASYDYTFDAASRITSVNSLNDGVTNYTHDNTDQLTGADHTGQTDEAYTYDLNGNRTMTGYSVGSNNRLLSDGTYNYTYDNEGNRLTRTNIATGEVTEYEWDYRNRLTKVAEKNSGGAVVETTENSYDVFDRWVRRAHDADGAGSGTAIDTFFANDGNQIALEFDGNAASDLSHRYLWGPAVDQLFADEQVTSLLSAGNTLWGLGDHIGTIRDIADRNESTGATTVTNHRFYDSFGNLTSESNAAVDLLFGYTGRAFDETTGLQNNWHRWYDPAVGQWLSEDPIGFQANDPNLRRYVENAPASAIDPTGLVETGMIPKRGVWSGTPGDSWYKPPGKLKPIRFRNGVPDFFSVKGAVYSISKTDALVRITVDNTPIDAIDKGHLKSILNARRCADERKAIERMREILDDPKWKPPNGYTWHHIDADGLMVLVKTPYHKAAVPHRGGFALHIGRLAAKGKVKVGGTIKSTAYTFFITVGANFVLSGNLEAAISEGGDSLNPIFGGNLHAPGPLPRCPSDGWFEAKLRWQAEVERLERQKDVWLSIRLAMETDQFIRSQIIRVANQYFAPPEFIPENYGYTFGTPYTSQ